MKTLATVLLAAGFFLAGCTAAHAQATALQDRPAALAPDAIFAQAGRASATTTFTLGLQWDWNRSWHVGERGLVSGDTEASIGHWRADEGGGSAVVTQVGFTPTFRYWPGGARTGWFYEGGVGLNVLTPIYRTREKRFSTAFNFGDHIALGYKEQDERGWEWSLRLQHYSNAGIDQPNPGENFVQVRVVVPLHRQAG